MQDAVAPHEKMVYTPLIMKSSPKSNGLVPLVLLVVAVVVFGFVLHRIDGVTDGGAEETSGVVATQ